jgi:peptidoglycan/xylan/chitin deacetylase (PgdA/CDA1 family)
MSNRTTFYQLALGGLYYSGAYHSLKNRFSGVAALLTLHHVVPGGARERFSPNRILEITPEFLEATIIQVRGLGYEIVSLDEFQRRLIEKDFRTRFVGFTLDDGYADNYHHAFPIFRKHQAPFAIYVCTGLLDGSIDLWWRSLEDIVLRESRVEVVLNGVRREFETNTTRQKYLAFETIYWALRRMPLKLQLVTIQAIKERYFRDTATPLSTDVALSWDMIAEMQRSSLLTIGAHTVNHYALSKLSPGRAQEEMALSRDLIEERTSIKPAHFAYPYGDALSAANQEFNLAKELGFSTAVTTRKGIVFPEHARHLCALPRVSLNGDYQQARNVKLFMSGLPFALYNGFRKLDVD